MTNIQFSIKRLLPKPIYRLIAHICNRKSAPYSLLSNFILPQSVSDFFVWSPYAKEIYFVAENTRALIMGQKVFVMHYFRFYSYDGSFLHEESHKSDEFFCRAQIGAAINSSNYCSFTHHARAIFIEQEMLFQSLLNQKNKLVCEQNRGYCIYYPNIAHSLGAAVHGNFGGISNDNILLARQREPHVYTPSYIFYSKNNYDLVFNNPTSHTVVLNILYRSLAKTSELFIQPLGTIKHSITSYSGILSFESLLPICRPIIFKNPDSKLSIDFDVLHS